MVIRPKTILLITKPRINYIYCISYLYDIIIFMNSTYYIKIITFISTKSEVVFLCVKKPALIPFTISIIFFKSR